MGKISEYIIELGETFEEILSQAGDWDSAKDIFRDQLSNDEWEFFLAHEDIIKENIDDSLNPWIHEARGLKGDVLRPWGGRKARSDMGYGRGNRAGYNPEDEIPTSDELDKEDIIMQDIEDDDGAPLTSEIIGGEEVFDVGSEDDWMYDTPETHAQRMAARKEMLAKPPPVGTGGVDNVFDKDGKRINEDFGVFQQAGLVILAGVIAIGIINGKGSEEATGFRMWAEKLFPKLKDKRVQKIAGAGLKDYAEGNIDIEALEELLNQDPTVKRAIEEMKYGHKSSYTHLYSFIKRSMNIWSIQDTPGREIKGHFDKIGAKATADRAAKKKEAKSFLELYGDGKISYQELTGKLDYPDIIQAMEEYMANPRNYRRFYDKIKGFYRKGRLEQTPAKQIKARLLDEVKNARKNDLQPGNPEDFDKKHAPMESLEMPSIVDFKEDSVIERRSIDPGHPQSKYDSDGERKDPYGESGHTVNGKRVTWEELWRWYETEGEYGD